MRISVGDFEIGFGFEGRFDQSDKRSELEIQNCESLPEQEIYITHWNALKVFSSKVST